jgi:hypothetical protein
MVGVCGLVRCRIWREREDQIYGCRRWCWCWYMILFLCGVALLGWTGLCVRDITVLDVWAWLGGVWACHVQAGY